MGQQNWRFPSLSRDLAIIGAGIVLASACVGAAVGALADVLIYRHRKA